MKTLNSSKTFSVTTSRCIHISRKSKKKLFSFITPRRRTTSVLKYRGLEKKDSLDEIMTIFKRRFGDYLSRAKTRCEWDVLNFDPSTQTLHERFDVLQKTSKKAFGSEAQQFIDKAIYAKMPDHVKNVFNRGTCLQHMLRTNHLTTTCFIWKKK